MTDSSAKSTSSRKPGHPEPAEVVALRESIQAARECGITEAQGLCADWLITGIRSWQQWERGERKMHPAFWELASIKADRYLKAQRRKRASVSGRVVSNEGDDQ